MTFKNLNRLMSGALKIFQGALLFSVAILASSCASTADKPIKQMVYTSAAMKAAERAQSEKRSPDLYRRAENRFWKSKQLYLAKEYQEAGRAANDARRLAERAELDAELRLSQAVGDEE